MPLLISSPDWRRQVKISTWTAASSVLSAAILTCSILVCPAAAEDKSFYSPIIHVNKEKGYIIISNSGAVFPVELPEAARPHIDKLPVSGLIDIVVELRPGNAPLLKKWKITSGESTCKIFDGKVCKGESVGAVQSPPVISPPGEK